MNADLEIILSADPVEAIEAAKRIIGSSEVVDTRRLASIAANRNNQLHSRVAAIYALGYVDASSETKAVLLSILADRSDNGECRAHAAESLGHMRGSAVLHKLEDVLMSDDAPEVKRWCIYALSEIGGASALRTLRKFATTGPTGELAEELGDAFTSMMRRR